ncbi:hypothetical protein SERLA73DRAFT_48218 [Serpula lacrymans var. lacrymans S7.3]|uniref:Uncharacterized protein n=1 Tax=Serpula lacrymans var. lacrymans (strain S7.3) TaxID=936435 RepID=F8PNF3_SERL3|nr:hypothetical protein SERLA73DRAFT_48218 [Serpula lacrymans var. lacrymans S7.3]
MHFAGNLSELLLALWHGMIDCDATDDHDSWDWAVLADGPTWDRYGESVHSAGSHLPGVFGTRPRNIAEKLTSGYKTWEMQLHTFGLGPILLYNILPDNFFSNYCKLVRGFQIMCQHQISTQALVDAHSLLCQWEREFEDLYYQYWEDHIHFVRPCVHQVNHLVTKTQQKGPPICYAQWTMERTIGNLGQETRQPSNPYANLAQKGVRRCRVNSLLAAMPELGVPPKGLPDGAVELGDGYVLLRKRDRYFSRSLLNTPKPFSCARLKLRNGQIARNVWRESLKSVDKLQVSQNVSFSYSGQLHFGEVQYFTQLAYHQQHPQDAGNYDFHNVAVIKMYSPPDNQLLDLSSQTVTACILTDQLVVSNVKDIKNVVAMILRRLRLPSGVEETRFCSMYQPGLDVADLGIPYNIYEDDNDKGGEVD